MDEFPPPDAQEVEDTLETKQITTAVPRDQMDEVHEHATILMDAVAQLPEGDLINEMIATSLKLLRDRNNRADLKLINTSLKELRYALKVFEPYKDVRKISIFGSARTPEAHDDYTAAVDFGRRIVDKGWMVITGAGGGIMAAGHGGAGAKPSFGLAIRLPFEQKTNPFIEGDPKLINFKYFFTRKLMFVRSSHAVAVFPGGFGTMDEGFEVLTLIQTGKAPPMPIVFVDHPGSKFWQGWEHFVKDQLLGTKVISPEDVNLYKVTQSVDEAMDEVTRFYSNFHSTRYVRDTLVMRIQRKPSPKQMDEINRRFGSICVKGRIELSDPLPLERDEPSLQNLPRLVLQFNRREHGILRLLINYLNTEV
ncbi:MAG: LOG family protein [Tepidisphaeraceae bacterium]